MMNDGFRFADSLGPNKIVHIYEPTRELRAVLVIDNVACGPAIGRNAKGHGRASQPNLRLATGTNDGGRPIGTTAFAPQLLPRD